MSRLPLGCANTPAHITRPPPHQTNEFSDSVYRKWKKKPPPMISPRGYTQTGRPTGRAPIPGTLSPRQGKATNTPAR